jgi:hypothetical protein
MYFIYRDDEIRNNKFLSIVSSIVFFVFGGNSFYYHLKNGKKVVLNKENLTFGNKTYQWSDVKNIMLTGSYSFYYISEPRFEATKIEFNDGTNLLIFDSLYHNANEMKIFLQTEIIDSSKPIAEINDTSTKFNDYDDNFETFKGSPIFSMRGISLWGMLGYFIYSSLKLDSTDDNGFIRVLICLFWFFSHSSMMYYFKCSTTDFVIKNHIYFWVNKTYFIHEIEDVVFEQKGKLPNTLRIITKDFKNETYWASTLSDEHWLNLAQKLESLKIKVRG